LKGVAEHPRFDFLARLRPHLLLLAVLAVAAPLYFFWTWTNELGDLGNDATDYLMMAAHYSPFAGENEATRFAAAFSRFPPLYPLILAWSGAAVADLHRAHAVTTSFLLLALGAWYAWLLRQRLAPAPAALLVLAVAALPGTWLVGLNLHSEYPYLLWSVLALLFLSRHEADKSAASLYAAALFVASAALTRTVGVALFAPLLVAALRGGRRPGLLALAMAASPVLMWHLLHRSRHGYGAALMMYYGGHALELLRAQLPGQLQALRAGFAECLSPFGRLPLVTDALGLACAFGAAWRAARLRPDSVYIAAYLGVLLFWPYPNVAQRLVWAVLPLLLAQPLLILAEAPRGPVPARSLACGSAAIAGAILLLALPVLAQAATRFRDAAYSGLPGARGYEGWYAADPGHAVHRVFSQQVFTQALRQIPAVVPESGCVIATRMDLVNYYGMRQSALPPENSVPDVYFMQWLRAGRCRYVFMYNATDDHYPVPLYPLQRLAGHLQILRYINVHDPAGGEPQGGVVCIVARLLE
jgi:hypothetical protein